MKKHSQRGQSAVEYAILIALVAIVVIAIVFGIGLAVERGFGIIVGALGAKRDATGQNVIEITTAQCIGSQTQNLTGLWVVGNTNIDISTLTGSTNLAIGTGLGGAPFQIQPNGANGFKFNPLLANGVDLTVCPKSVVIQAQDGTEAVSPVTTLVLP